MEQALVEVLQYLAAKFPWVIAVYSGLSGLYMAFCAIATLTKTDKDDKLADKLKVFFSLPIGKK